MTEILIVGGGLTGLLAAILAKRNKISVVVVERQSQGSLSQSNAHYLNAYSIEILVSAGLSYEQLCRASVDPDIAKRMVVCHRLDQTLGKIDLADDPNYAERFRRCGQFGGHLNIRATRLHQLLSELAETKQIEIIWDHLPVEVNCSDRHVRLRNINNHDERLIHAKYLLACDGANGDTARLAGISSAEKTHFMDFLTIECRGSIQSFVQDQAMMYWIYHESMIACLIAYDLDHTQILQIPLVGGANVDLSDEEKFRERFANICGVSCDRITHEFSIQSRWRLQTGLLPRAQKNNWLFIVGDALHQILPSGGIGLNTGFADVYNLIWKICADVDSERSHFSVTYEEERYPNAENAIMQSIENYKGFIDMGSYLTANFTGSINFSAEFADKFSTLFQYWLQLMRHLHALAPVTTNNLQALLDYNQKHFDGMTMHYQVYYAGRLTLFPSQRRFYDLAVLPLRIFPGMRIQNYVCRIGVIDYPIGSLLNYPSWALIYQCGNQKVACLSANMATSTTQIIELDQQPEGNHYLSLGDSEVLVIRPDRFVFAYVDLNCSNAYAKLKDHIKDLFRGDH